MFLKRIWYALAGDRHLMAFSVLFGLLFTGLGIVPPLLVRRMIHWLERPETAGNFVGLGLLMAGVYLLRGGSRYLYGLMSHIAAYRTLHRLMNRVYRHLQSLSPGYLKRRHSGNLVARTVGDVEEIEDFIAHGIPETMLAVVIPIAMSVVLFLLNWKLALIALLPLPVMAALIYVITTRTRNYWKGVRRRFADLSARIQDHVAGLTAIQSFTQEARMAERIRRQSREYRDSIIYANTWSLVPAGIIEAASGAGLVLIVCSAGPLSGWIQIGVADLVVFLLYLSQIFLPFLRLANLTEHLQKATASADRVFDLLDTTPEIVDGPQTRIESHPAEQGFQPTTNNSQPANEFPRLKRFEVQFDAVDFAYEAGSPVLQNVSWTIEEGETVALVGMTGVGKSTACHLLARFYDVDAGTIRLGGHDIRTLPVDYLRRQVALVTQDVVLFHGTIRDNLLLGNPEADEEELQDACRAARAEEFILACRDGYETVVGERGVRLSGGQKQRIAIVRALLKDAPVLVLDEATSAVDAETEHLIREAVMQATVGRTVLLVAHRLSTIMAADRIVVLDEGRVVETGTYEELLAGEGAFARLCRLNENVLW